MRLYARIEVRTCTCRLADAGMMGLLPDVIAAISNIAPETGNSRIYKVFRMVFNCFVSTSALITKVVSTKTLIKLKSKPSGSVIRAIVVAPCINRAIPVRYFNFELSNTGPRRA